jgi:integrase
MVGLALLPEPRLNARNLPSGPRGGPFDLPNLRREWGAAIESAGITRPARVYDLRSTFASNALAAGIAEEWLG